MKTDEIDIAENILEMIKNLDADVQRRLINKISDSLKEADQEKNDGSWKKLFGAWESDESAEEIIKEIRASRHTARQIEDL
jgi:hypothetical protein